ncbi:hypothetical protein DFH09DRAFT_1095044 [Mycena vulgaris]|nr:hypothetical protein DFH09DRAFT_1095044 [Mycena vulgaris]
MAGYLWHGFCSWHWAFCICIREGHFVEDLFLFSNAYRERVLDFEFRDIRERFLRRPGRGRKMRYGASVIGSSAFQSGPSRDTYVAVGIASSGDEGKLGTGTQANVEGTWRELIDEANPLPDLKTQGRTQRGKTSFLLLNVIAFTTVRSPCDRGLESANEEPGSSSVSLFNFRAPIFISGPSIQPAADVERLKFGQACILVIFAVDRRLAPYYRAAPNEARPGCREKARTHYDGAFAQVMLRLDRGARMRYWGRHLDPSDSGQGGGKRIDAYRRCPCAGGEVSLRLSLRVLRNWRRPLIVARGVDGLRCGVRIVMAWQYLDARVAGCIVAAQCTFWGWVSLGRGYLYTYFPSALTHLLTTLVPRTAAFLLLNAIILTDKHEQMHTFVSVPLLFLSAAESNDSQ